MDVKKLHICVIAPEIHDPVSHEMLNGISSCLEKNNTIMDIISAGGVIFNNGEKNKNFYLYELIIKLKKYDGVIIFAGALSNFTPEEVVSNYISFIPDKLPVLCMSLKLADHDFLMVDNYSSVKSLVTHLVHEHNKKRIAFIKGPNDHKEAGDRFQGYLDGLKENDLIYDGNIIFEGDYSPLAGAKAVQKIISGNISIDAIVCADDDTALGVYGEFRKNSIDIVKEKIAVTGFDNMEFTKGLNPPLTTIDQSLFLQGRKALEVIVKKIKGENTTQAAFIPHIVYRGSCGCKKKANSYIYDSRIIDMDSHIIDLSEFCHGKYDTDLIKLQKRIDYYIEYYIQHDYSLAVLSDIISEVFDTNDIDISSVVKKSLLNITHKLNNIKITESRLHQDLSSEVDSLMVELIRCSNYEELICALDRYFYYIGIRSLTLHFPNTKNVELCKLSGRHFCKEKNLHFEDDIYYNLYLPVKTKYEKGYCNIHINAKMFEIAEVISFQIARVLYLIELFIDLENKILELQNSYNDLKETKELLLESEHLANIGGLVSGFTHEINTPIGVSFTAVSHFSDELYKLKDMFISNTMKKTDLEHYIDDCEDLLGIVLSNLERTISLNKEFKQIAVDQSSGAVREFELGAYIKEIVHSLSPMLKKTKHNVVTDINKKYVISSYPGVFSQIIINLIQNSLIHGFENIESGVITLSITKKEGSIYLRYTDNGCGLKREVLDRIFETYYSTKIGRGGSGLGMTIVKKLVSEKLKGDIECFSEYGKGIEFIISVPTDN